MDTSARTTRSKAKHLPPQRKTRNSAKASPLYTNSAPQVSQRGKYIRNKIVPVKTETDIDDNNDDIIESSQEPAAGQQFDSEFESQFVIERDTCQMSPLLFDSDSDCDDGTSQDAVPIANNQQQQANHNQQHRRTSNPGPALPLTASPIEKTPSSSEPLLDLPTSTTETDTDLSQPLHKANTDSTAAVRRRTNFRSFKCAPARLTRLAALREERLHATAPPPVAPMHPPRLKTPASSGHSKRPQPAKRVRPTYPSSSSEFSVASDISVAMTARRNVISGDSDELNPRQPYEPYELCTARNQLVDNADTFDVLPGQREPSTSQELQVIEHKSVIISLSSSTDDYSRSQPRQRLTAGSKPTATSSATVAAHKRRSPDLFDTYDGDETVPTLPRRIMSFFDPPRASFFARLSSQAAALAACNSTGANGSTPARRQTPSQARQARRRDESIDIFGDNATFIETPHRPTQLATDETGASASVTLSPQQQHPSHPQQHRDTSTNMANTTSVFEITKNDVFPHLIRMTSDSDMSPIKMSDDDQQQISGPSKSAFKLPSTSTPLTKENFVDPDVNNTGVIAASQDQQEQLRTPLKLTLYERLCRTDPSRQFGSHRRRKSVVRPPAPGPSQSVIRTPERKRGKSLAAKPDTPGSTSPERKRRLGGGARLQKWGSDERATKTAKAVWTGRRLDDYFAKASTSSSSATTAPKTDASAKGTISVKPMASFQLLVLSSDDER